MRRPHAAAVVLLLWLAVLTVAFHGCGRGHGHGCGGLVAATTKRLSSSISLPRKMLLAVTSNFDAAPSPTTADHHHHHHHHHRHHHHEHHRHFGRWNRRGIPPSLPAGKNGEGVDPRYGVEKRLVPTGPNPLHH
ncbi:hypothetical protein EJB05_23995, partial [Eragrostis curvula]